MARWITLATVTTLDPDDRSISREKHLAHARTLLSLAGDQGADLVVLPECFLQFGDPNASWFENPPTLPTKEFETLASLAAKHRFNLVIGTLRNVEGVRRNSAILVGRDGRVIGGYDKMFPTLGEIESGICPGADATVLATDIGRIGFAICFDANFIEVFEGARENGAELLVFSSMYRGGTHLVAWAFEFEYPIVACCPYYSAVIDMTGRLLAETGLDLQPVAGGWVPGLATARINLDRRMVHFDGHVRFNDGSGDNRLWEAKKKYGGGLSIDITAWHAALCALGSELPDKSVEEIAREFRIELCRDYLARARKGRKEAIGG
ncbi:MAG: carbon-nitrogen hydrolase family protein [Planctomycetota bacterium]